MIFPPINFKAWIDEHRDQLKPPVANKMVWKEGELIIMVVGGPNARKDYHYNPTPEFFYQIEGDMVLKIKNGEKFEDIAIKEGEIFLLPSGIPHSPQRKANTIGLVIEQLRPFGHFDGLQWYCQNCYHKLYDEYFILSNIENQLPPVFDRFFNNIEHCTCKKCGTVMTR